MVAGYRRSEASRRRNLRRRKYPLMSLPLCLSILWQHPWLHTTIALRFQTEIRIEHHCIPSVAYGSKGSFLHSILFRSVGGSKFLNYKQASLSCLVFSPTLSQRTYFTMCPAALTFFRTSVAKLPMSDFSFMKPENLYHVWSSTAITQ